MATRHPKFSSSEPEVFMQASGSSRLVRHFKESITKTRRPMFLSSERDLQVTSSSSARHRIEVHEKVKRRRPTMAVEHTVDLTGPGSSSGSLVIITSNSKPSAKWPTISEDDEEIASQPSPSSSRREVVYCAPTLKTEQRASDTLARRVVRRCHAAKFVSPYEKCTLMMQAGARKKEVAHATARKRQLKDFNIRLKCSCLPKRSRPPTPEPEDAVLELEPDEKYVGLQSDLFPEPVQEWPYVPAAYYDEQETQVECCHGQDLEVVGDFDQEVEPHLAMLVGTALQQAMWEVVEHNEVRVDKERRRRVEAVIAGEKAETTRLRNQDERLVAEKKRRVEQFKEACRLQAEVSALMQELNTWIPEHPWVQLEALEGFKKAGYLLQEIQDSVDRDAMTWIWLDTNTRFDKQAVARDLLAEMIENISLVRTVIHQILGRRFPSDNAVPVVNDSESSSSSVDFFNEEWEIKEAGWVDPKDTRRGRMADSLFADSHISGKSMSETLAEYLNPSTGRTIRGTLVPPSEGDTNTMLSWTKAINFNRDVGKVYGGIESLDNK